MPTKKYQYQQPQPQEPEKGWGHIETDAEKAQKRINYEKAAEAARKKVEMERMIRLCSAISSSIIYIQQEIENEKKRTKSARTYQAQDKPINARQETYNNA